MLMESIDLSRQAQVRAVSRLTAAPGDRMPAPRPLTDGPSPMLVKHLFVGILIGLFAGSGCAGSGLVVRTDRGREVGVDAQRVRPVHYEKEELQKAMDPFAEHLAALVLQRERGLQLRLSEWSMPADPLQRALIEGYLGECQQRGQFGDCWEVLDGQSPGVTVDAKRTIASRMALSFGLREAAEVIRNVNPVKLETMMLMWFAFYLASFVLPDVTITKLIFMTMSAGMIAFLGVDGFRNIIMGYRTMRQEAAEAQTFDQLRGAAQRYGQRMGPSALRIAVAVVTWGLCRGTGLGTSLAALPGAPQAAANAEAMGFELAAVNGGSVAVSATGTVTLVLMTEATVPERGGGPNRALRFTERDLQKGFTKHGADFGLGGSWNPSRAEEFRAAVLRHINGPGVRMIEGTYRGDPVVHYLDPKTGLDVIADMAGNYVSGWKLGAEQLESVLSTGRLF
jgi:colicin D